MAPRQHDTLALHSTPDDVWVSRQHSHDSSSTIARSHQHRTGILYCKCLKHAARRPPAALYMTPVY